MTKTPRCPTKWKQPHATKAAAERHLAGLRARGTARGQHVYRCPAGHWHVGSKFAHARSRIDRRRKQR